jgi:hypothetical protein
LNAVLTNKKIGFEVKKSVGVNYIWGFNNFVDNKYLEIKICVVIFGIIDFGGSLIVGAKQF